MRWVGVGYRGPLTRWIASRPPELECLEITAEYFFDGGLDYLQDLRRSYPIFVHGLGLSLGTPGPLDPKALARFAQVVDAADPEWVSEHIAFTRTAEVDLGHWNPVAPDEPTLAVLAEHAQQVAETCRKPLILENIASHVRPASEMTETEFLNRLCERADCGLLLDVTNLYINSKNHGFDPLEWLRRLNPQHIVQLHVVGYSFSEGRWQDLHSEPIQPELFELVSAVLSYAPAKAVILERDSGFPEPSELAAELRALKACDSPL